MPKSKSPCRHRHEPTSGVVGDKRLVSFPLCISCTFREEIRLEALTIPFLGERGDSRRYRQNIRPLRCFLLLGYPVSCGGDRDLVLRQDDELPLQVLLGEMGFGEYVGWSCGLHESSVWDDRHLYWVFSGNYFAGIACQGENVGHDSSIEATPRIFSFNASL